MPPTKDKEAQMACKLSEETVFIRKQEGLRADCLDILSRHLTANPDVIWEAEDGSGPMPGTKRERAKLKLVLDVTFNKETRKPIFPPPNTRLSDELVYLATKFETGPGRAVRYPYDFDKSGDIDPDRVPSGPAPIIWAHGLPFFPVFKGYYILCGRIHAECIGWLLHEKTRILMHKSPMWSIGAVIAPDSAVMLPHTIERQIIVHKPQGSEKDLRYKGKAWTRDVVTNEHQLCAVFPNLGSEEIDVCPLWKAEGYNVHCGPAQRDMKPNFMPKEFFTRHGIVGIDYATLARPYSNSLLDSEGEDLYQEKDTNKIVESGDLPGSCAGVTSSSDQTVNTHSTSEMDVDMETDSMTDIPQIVPEQKQVQLPKVITELAPAQVPNQLSEQVPEEALKQPTEEATDVIMEQGPEDNNGNSGVVHSSLEDNPGVDSSATASHGHDLNVIIEDLNIEISESTASKQTDNAVIFPLDTSPERATIVPQTTSVQLIVEQPEADTTGEISTSEPATMEPATMEQVANDQPGSEKSFQTAADDLPEKPSFTEHPTAQPAPDNDIEISAKAPVENGD